MRWLLVLVLAGCGDKTLGPGEACETTDECGDLTCMSPVSNDGGTCEPTGADICTGTCENEVDCSLVGPDMICVEQCDGTAICEPT